MKKVHILSNCLVPSGKADGDMKTLYVGSVVTLDDDVAGQLIAAQRARSAADDVEEVDTTPKPAKPVKAAEPGAEK